MKYFVSEVIFGDAGSRSEALGYITTVVLIDVLITKGIGRVAQVTKADDIIKLADNYKDTGKAPDINKGARKTPSANTKVEYTPEVKAPNAIKATDVTNAWDNYLGKNTTNINPRTGVADPDRIFSADGTKSIRFGKHERESMGTTKGHFHYETWTYDAITDTITVTNTLQRIIP